MRTPLREPAGCPRRVYPAAPRDCVRELERLLIARAAAAERQWAICQALGASRARLAQQIVLESLMLSLAAPQRRCPGLVDDQVISACCGSARSHFARPMTPKLPVLVLTRVISVAAGLIIGALPEASPCASGRGSACNLADWALGR